VAKHTSGPWGITEDGDYIRQVNGGRRLYIAAVLEVPIEGETQANARLLAAAPELLEALKESLPQLRWANVHGSRCDELIAEVVAAIAKAEGRDE